MLSKMNSDNLFKCSSLGTLDVRENDFSGELSTQLPPLPMLTLYLDKTIYKSLSSEKETPELQRPHTFLRQLEDNSNSTTPSSSSSSSVRACFEKMVREAQDSVCSTIKGINGGEKFQEDV
ncbi:hypothetical protein LOK49_LG12G00266 [Camellia lanceoleosa]|uniref:Uncharacterized protein n=1 Tax=Camellia lanceoleosa TaxID=1840588 RepID=A0ACC0FY65_9ERIC|nr:hypothetical protein LOK49_LG12G00266 [Camellia lanceoleosa]